MFGSLRGITASLSLFMSAYSTKMPFQSKIMKHTMLESYEQVQREVEMKTGTRP